MITPTDEQIEAVLRLPVADGEDVAFYLLHGCEGVSPEVEAIMVREVARTILAATYGLKGTSPEPIPDRVYWAPLADNFYDAHGRGQGVDFYQKWKPRRAEFPQGESFGWGKGSAHNPFKDAPRTASAGGPAK